MDNVTLFAHAIVYLFLLLQLKLKVFFTIKFWAILLFMQNSFHYLSIVVLDN